MIKHLFFLFAFLVPSLFWSADLNVTIIHGDASVYGNMLKKLEANATKSDEHSLEKTLLVKLIQLSRTKPEKRDSIGSPKHQDAYGQLFLR